jgi:N-acetylmuramoyl-L-alanine amidase CwlA
VIRSRDPFRLNHIDTYSNILYVKEKISELSSLAHSVVDVSHIYIDTPLELHFPHFID